MLGGRIMDRMGVEAEASGMDLADLSAAESLLWSSFARGEVVDLSSWDPASRRVRAEVVAALLLGAVAPTAGHVAGIRLTGAVVSGAVDVRHGVVECPVAMTDCVFDEGLILASARTRAVDLAGSDVTAVDASGALIDGDLILAGCSAIALILSGAHVSGLLDLSGATLRNPGGDALLADRLTVDGTMACRNGFRAEGMVRLDSGHVSGLLDLGGAQLINPGGVALFADGLTVDGVLACRAGFRAEGSVRFPEADVSGLLDLDASRQANPGGIALFADGLTVGGLMVCRGSHVDGVVRLPTAHIRGGLLLHGTHLANLLDSRHLTYRLDPGLISRLPPMQQAALPGVALFAERLTVDGDVFCRDGFRAQGAVRFLGARIAGRLDFKDAALCGDGPQALDCFELTADRLYLKNLTMTKTATVDLRSAHVKVLEDQPETWPQHILLDGFTYDNLQPRLPAKGSAGRLAWLGRDHDEYRAQPYEQLAAYYKVLGQDDESRTVLRAKLLRQREGRGYPAKILSYALDALVGFGYRPSRAFLWLVSLLVAGSFYFAVNRPVPLDPAHHPPFEPILYAASLLIPLVNLGQANTWQLTGAGQWVSAILTGLGWLFATAAVAGVTRVLTRK